MKELSTFFQFGFKINNLYASNYIMSWGIKKIEQMCENIKMILIDQYFCLKSSEMGHFHKITESNFIN